MQILGAGCGYQRTERQSLVGASDSGSIAGLKVQRPCHG